MKIAVVIPALDESSEIRAAVQSASAPGVEVVVVDGGSRDDTAEQAQAAGARLLRSGPGRARQLQAGVAATSAEVLLFLHADTRLAPTWSAAVQKALEADGVAGGAFRFRFDREGALLRAVEWGVRLRVALFALPYGDQAIFVRRRVLDAMGGVPRAVLMEDLDLVREIKRRGKLAMLDLPATTSGRRHVEAGVVGTALRHSLAALGWRLGVDRERMRRWLGR